VSVNATFANDTKDATASTRDEAKEARQAAAQHLSSGGSLRQHSEPQETQQR